MKLTAKESKIIAMLAQGKSDKQICAEVGLAHGTVRNLLRIIYAKLDANNRTSAAANYVKLYGMPGDIGED